MALPRNPYIAGNPVGNSPAFVGRADVLREVLRVLRHGEGNAIVLFGQRRIGKTSVLQQLEVQLPGEGEYHPVYFDLMDMAEWPLGRVLGELARKVAFGLGQPEPELGEDPEAAFRQAWLPAVLGEMEAGCSLVLLFDEFDVLASPQAGQAFAAFFPYLRGLLELDRQRLQFVFVIGRNVDDLDNIALSLFKGTPYQRVSLLNHEDTLELVRLAQQNDTLRWSQEAVGRVWALTSGHPLLTQGLCYRIWERLYDDDPEEPPSVTPEDVEAAVPEALEASRNTLEWLWGGLGPAERVVASTLASAGPAPIDQAGLENLLYESGVRVVIRELQNAPYLLQEWDLIEPADGGYRFRVELLRRWIAEHKPLRRVQEELDRIEPVAESFYQAGLGLYQRGELDEAVEPLRRAVGINPNHARASQLLAEILLAQGQPGEARELMEQLYQYQPAAARPRLVQTLLALAQAGQSEQEALALFERALDVSPNQPEAAAGRRRIWEHRAEAALEANQLEAALKAYQQAGLTEKVAEVEAEIRRRKLQTALLQVQEYEVDKHYREALELARRLAEQFPEVRDWRPDLERLERKTQLSELYQRALGALQSDDRETAKTLLAQVVGLEPDYEEATRYLYLAVTGVDVADLQGQLEEANKARQQAEDRAMEEASSRRQCEDELQELIALVEKSWIDMGTQEVATTEPVPAPSSNSDKPTARSRRLFSWNLLEHLRSLWGITEVLDKQLAGSWLASTLTWLPLLSLPLGMGVGTLPIAEGTLPPELYLGLGLVLALAWMLTGWLGNSESSNVAIVAVVVSGVVAFFLAGSVAVGIADGVISMWVVLAFFVAIGGAIAVADSVSGGVAVGVAGVVTIVVVFVVAIGLADFAADVVAVSLADIVTDVAYEVAASVVVGVVVFIVVVFLFVGVAGGVAVAVSYSLRTSQSYWLFMVWLSSNVFLIWFSFLGGYRVFQ